MSATIAAILQAAIGLGQYGYGQFQKRRALRALQELERNRPRIEVPAAFRRLAEEPVAESFMRAQTEALERQTAQAIDAASRMGSRSLLGILPTATENERIGNQQLYGAYNKAYTDALSTLGSVDMNVQNMLQQVWLNRVLGGRRELDAGNQDIFYGLSNFGYGAGLALKENQDFIKSLLSKLFKK